VEEDKKKDYRKRFLEKDRTEARREGSTWTEILLHLGRSHYCSILNHHRHLFITRQHRKSGISLREQASYMEGFFSHNIT
jgi:hypothetical protein